MTDEQAKGIGFLIGAAIAFLIRTALLFLAWPLVAKPFGLPSLTLVTAAALVFVTGLLFQSRNTK
jgi:hypothetical protein